MKHDTVDLDNCAQEPIHLSGAVQPHGVLLAVEPSTLRIEHASQNIAELLGVPAGEALGQGLDAVLDGATIDRLREHVAALHELRALASFEVHATRVPARFDGIVHRSGEWLLVELEPLPSADDARAAADFDQKLRDALSRLHGATRVEDLCRVGVEEIRRLTGFDRVMAYRFDPDDHGHVIAESKRDELETFLGLHYPASDIPAQARRLYTINWLRGIVDVGYQPVPIETRHAEAHPLDLSHSVLRSVSPIHVQYLKNMGIAASMSISVVVEGRLWGMFICHHYAPRLVPYTVRKGAEFLAQMLSWQIAARDRADANERRANADATLRSLVARLDVEASTLEGIVANPALLLEIVDASGACIVHEGRHSCAGAHLEAERLDALLEWLGPRLEGRAWATHALGEHFPPATEYAELASGLLAVPILGDGKSFVVWFRREFVQTVSWAGQPGKATVMAGGASRLTPRGSFALWRETVRGQSLRWEPWQLAIAEDFARMVGSIWVRRVAEVERLNRQLQATAEELREANLAKDDFLANLSHELRNPLNVILGWVRLLRGGDLPDERRAQALEIIDRNAQQQAKLVEDLLDVSRIVSGKLRLELARVELSEVVQLAVEGMRPTAHAKQIDLQLELEAGGAYVLGDPARLQQVLWNLLTNAVKFTAAGGRIVVRLSSDGETATIEVRDTGRGIAPELLEKLFERFRQAETGPGRSHQGLGLGLSIVRHLVELHGGTIHASSPGVGHGASFRVQIPLQVIDDSHTTPTPRLACPQIVGKEVLLVEDDADTLQMVAMELTRVGARVTVAADGQRALEALRDHTPALIISDVGMPGLDGFALMRHIRALPPESGGRAPSIALTAYSRAEDRTSAFRAGYQALVAKPADFTELFAVIASLLER